MEIDNIINIEYLNNLDVNDNEFEHECIKISHDVRNRKATIVQLVEKLELLLTDKNPQKRQQGTYILSYVLNALPKDFLYENQLNFISMFYCDRLKDHYKVIPAVVKGVLALVNYRLPEGQITKLFNALFQNISCQQQEQRVRHDIYRIFQIAWGKYQLELQNMSFDFIYGVISFIDGERDPRNLLFLFNWLPHFVKGMQLGHLVEEMFEVMSCYFPVSFKPFNKEEQETTREDLANALLPCLTAREDFAEYCILLALENLAASLKESKLDALKLLENGCETFPVEVYVSHSEALVEIQKEIFTTTDSDVRLASLNAFTAVINKLSNRVDVLKLTVQNVLDTIQGNLLPGAKLFDVSLQVVYCLIKASKLSSEIVIKQIAPSLSNTFNITQTKEHQVILLSNLAQLMATYMKEHVNGVLPEAQTIPTICLKAIEHDAEEVRCCAFKCLALLAEYLNPQTRQFLFSNLIALLNNVELINETDAIIKCFVSLAETFPEEADSFIKSMQIASINHVHKYLILLSNLLHIKYFFDKVFEELLNSCVGRVEPFCKIDAIETSKLALQILSNLSVNYLHLIKNVCKYNFVNHLVLWALNNSLINQVNDTYCKNLDKVLNSLAKFESDEDSHCTLENIAKSYKETKNEMVIVAMNGLICSTKLKIDRKIIGLVLQIALTTQNEYLHEMSVKLMGNIVNKITEDIDLKKLFQTIEASHSTNSIDLIAFICKALTMRDHIEKDVWLNKLVNLLENERAALGFKYIMNDTYYQFSMESFCNRKLLYRQKFFIQAYSILGNIKSKNALLAFSYMLDETPQSVLKLELDRIFPMIILCLDTVHNQDALLGVLKMLLQLIEDKSPAVEEHLHDLVPRFLKLSTYQPSMKTRVLALQCLQCYTNYPTYKLLPHKTEVLFGLISALDDKKRLVRKEAVEARSKWFLIDAPQ